MPPSMDELLKVGEVDQARQLADDTLRAKPGDRTALVTLARIATFEGDFNKAAALITKATLDGVEDTNSLLVKAALAAERDREIDGARQLYERAIRELKAPRAEPYFGLGMLLASAGRFVAAAKPLTQAVEIDPTVGQYHFHLARVLLATEKIAEGLPHLEQAIELNPLYPPAYEACCFVLLEFSEVDAAEKLLREGLKLMPGHPLLETLLSNVLVAKGQVPEAMALAQKLAAEHPKEPAALGNYARLMMATGHRDAALELVQQLGERGESTPQTLALEGMLLEATDPPDLDGAIAAYAAAAKMDGRDWGSLNNLAHVLMRRGEGEEAENLGAAVEALDEARRRAPWRLEPLMNLALAHARLEHTDDAKAIATEIVERAGPQQAELKKQAQQLLKKL